MKFKFVRDGVEEEVELQRWVWVALYTDGTFLMQYDDNTGIFHQVSEIDQSKLDVFVMQHCSDPSKRYEIHWKPHYQLIHFYRQWRQDGMPAGEWIPIYCFGYKVKDASGMVSKFIMEIMPNDIVAIKDSDGRKDD